MLKSNLFFTDKYKTVQEKIKTFLNSQQDFLNLRTIGSTRAVGDAIQGILSENLKSILGDYAINYSTLFGRRAMADLAFYDKAGFYYRVDVKTHRLDTKFNMPNLTSVKRLASFYEDDKNYFVILELAYSVRDIHIEVNHVNFVPIEFLSWDCLTVGALGWGQLQIANSNKINIIPKYSRKDWMLQFCERLLGFYPKEIDKIRKRVIFFKKTKQNWLKKI